MRLLDVPAEKNPRTKTTKKAAGDSAGAKPATAKAKPAAAKAKPTAVKAKPAAAKKEAKPARTPKRGGGTLVIVESPAKASTIKKYLGHRQVRSGNAEGECRVPSSSRRQEGHALRGWNAAKAYRERLRRSRHGRRRVWLRVCTQRRL